jgi:elongation factor Ts
MMECKKALTEAVGDMDRARDILRTRGKTGAEKRAGRAAAEGVVAAATTGEAAAIVELDCETDFVARNGEFQRLARDLAEIAARTRTDSPDVVLDQNTETGETARQRLEDVLAKLRENLVFRRFARYEARPDSVLGSYIHTVTNKIGALVELEGDPTSERHKSLARDIAMHVAANRPEHLTRENVTAEEIERERQILTELTRNEGKPEGALPKIVEGRLGKFFERVSLVEQPFVREPSKRISQLLSEAGASVRRFTLYVVGQ